MVFDEQTLRHTRLRKGRMTHPSPACNATRDNELKNRGTPDEIAKRFAKTEKTRNALHLLNAFLNIQDVFQAIKRVNNDSVEKPDKKCILTAVACRPNGDDSRLSYPCMSRKRRGKSCQKDKAQ